MNKPAVFPQSGPAKGGPGGTPLSDKIFRWLAIGAAALAGLLTIAFFLQLAWHSYPAFREFGPGFLCSTQWDTAEQKFGAAFAIYGTLITTAIALLIAVPAAFLTALFLVEIAPPLLSRVFGCALDLLAAIPSVIYGMWGLFVFVPFMQTHVQPFLSDTLGLSVIPLFDGPMTGFGFLTAGLVLALMSLPFMSAIMRDVFRMVPGLEKAEFANSVFYGSGSRQIELDFEEGAASLEVCSFDACLISMLPLPDTVAGHYRHCLWNQDPLFADEENYNFEIDTIVSPLVGTGDPAFATGAAASDIKGLLRAVPPCIGAYEFDRAAPAGLWDSWLREQD